MTNLQEEENEDFVERLRLLECFERNVKHLAVEYGVSIEYIATIPADTGLSPLMLVSNCSVNWKDLISDSKICKFQDTLKRLRGGNVDEGA